VGYPRTPGVAVHPQLSGAVLLVVVVVRGPWAVAGAAAGTLEAVLHQFARHVSVWGGGGRGGLTKPSGWCPARCAAAAWAGLF
jgi:hypothetical protein